MRAIIPNSSFTTDDRPSSLVRDPATLDPGSRTKRRERLRAIHLECGVDPAFLTLPPEHTLWFVSVHLDVQVHAGCLGFTRSLYEFALGRCQADAIETVTHHFAKILPHATVLGATAGLSNCIHPEELTFPEQVRRKDIPDACGTNAVPKASEPKRP